MIEESSGAFCRRHGISRQTLSRWRHTGHLRVTGTGAIDAAATDAALRDAGLGNFREQSTPPDGALAAAERAREVAIARLRQAQLRRRQRRLLSVEDCRTCWCAAVEHTKAALRAMVPALLAAAEGKAQAAASAALRDVVHGTLEALAGTEFEGVARPENEAPSLRAGASLREARTARVAAIAGLRALDLGIAEGRLVSATAFERLGGIHFANARNLVLALPYRLAPRLVGASGAEAVAIVQEAVEGALTDLPDDMPDLLDEPAETAEAAE